MRDLLSIDEESSLAPVKTQGLQFGGDAFGQLVQVNVALEFDGELVVFIRCFDEC